MRMRRRGLSHAEVIAVYSRADEGGCLIWTGSTAKGYPKTSLLGRTVAAHRLAYEATYGPIPEGLTIDHLCRQPLCVNPEHMEPVTVAVNTLRGESGSAINARKTECVRGHAFDAENTRVGPDGHRTCRKCRRLYYYATARGLTIREYLNEVA